MTNYKPYEEYKDSDTPWLGNIPKHWNRLPIQAITKVKSVKKRPDLQLLSVYRDYGVILKSSRDDNHNKEGADLSTYKVVKPGNLVLNKMKTWQGSLGVSELEGIVSPAYIICELFGDIFPKYIHYLLRSKLYIAFYNQYSFGVRCDQWDMRYNDFKRLPVFLPSVEEQEQIAKFITAKEKQVKKFISNKKKLIKLLNEQKQAIINQAVTKGLDPNVALKPSGVDWLGDIPEHWETQYFFQTFKEKCIKNTDGIEKNRLSLSYGKIIRKDIEDYFGLLPTSYNTYQIVEPNNIILRLTDLQNDHKSLRVGLVEEKGIITSAYVCLVILGEILPKYAALLLHSFDIRKIFYGMGGGVRQSTGFKDLKKLPFLVPSIEEQKAIINYLSSQLNKIESTISKYNKEIELIQEYRTRLISDVVTGKIDVRDIFVEDTGIDITDIEEELETLDESKNIEDTEELEVEYA